MTVTYSLDVATSSFFCLYRLLLRWKGSVWKSIWIDLTVWLIVYLLISVIYRFVMSSESRSSFEQVCVFFETYSDYIPLTFILGFYVSAVFNRWWQVLDNIGWIDAPGLMITQQIQGSSERARMIRRNSLRYMVLTQALVFRDVSAGVRRRFPTLNHIVAAGLMTEDELLHYDAVQSQNAKYWQPMHWLFNNLRIARKEGFIDSDIIYCDLLERIRIFRGQVLSLTIFDWVPVPLVYTQVVNLAVRMYFLVALFGRQYLDPDKSLTNHKTTIDLYFPIMTTLQFVFYVGWLKVAEVLLNPLGEDDDDFECNWILDRNLQVGFLMVDEEHNKFPALKKDAFWEDSQVEPFYTAETIQKPVNPMIGSCAGMDTSEEPFMLRCRRNASKLWDGDIQEDDVVPVYGLRNSRDSISRDMSETPSFSQSVISQGRRFSDIFSKIRGKNNVSDITNRMGSRKMDWNDAQLESNVLPRTDSLQSADFGEDFYNMASPKRPSSDAGGKETPDSLVPQRVALEPYHADEESQRSPSNVNWFVDQLPVIHEEEPKKSSDAESLKSSSSSGKTLVPRERWRTKRNPSRSKGPSRSDRTRHTHAYFRRKEGEEEKKHKKRRRWQSE